MALLLTGMVLLAGGAVYLAADWWTCLPEGKVARYVGRQQCARCHPKETQLWTGSDHDRAMDRATPDMVLGDFDDREFVHSGITSRMFRRGKEYCITTDGPDGKLDTYPIKYTFGVRPLQQYLVEFPDGRVQCLSIAWDTENRKWFHLYPDEKIPHDDPLHWTRPLQNWNYMCAECHSTNLQKNYDLAGNCYRSTWSEIDVSCETCHGPGSLHVELADSISLFWDRKIGYGLPRLEGEDSRAEIESCAPCHSRRRVVYPGYRAGEKYLDYYMPELLDRDLYYADGQILDEDYVYGSFIQSTMYHKGVRCTDCHDPHSLAVKHTDPKAPWGTMPENRLCTDCHMGAHPVGTYDSPAHHHHPDSTKPGTKCVECHMPETTYMGVDPRRDHRMGTPRPDLTISLGIPNACNGCHHDESKGETPQWAEQQVQDWYGKRKGPRHFAHALAAGRNGAPGANIALDALTRRQDLSAMVRASAILLLARSPSGVAHAAARRGLRDPDALVRAAAVRALESLDAEPLRRSLTPMLRDPIRAVRTEAARILSRVPRNELRDEDLQALNAALAEYMTGQESLADQPAAHLNMAVVLANLGRPNEAEREYRTALRLDPRFVPARINLAMLCNAQQRNVETEKLLREVIELEPKMAEAHYSLALLLAEQEGRLAEASESLATAARLAPRNARIHYNYALALDRLERNEEAEKEYTAACKLDAVVPDYLRALTILYVQQQRWARAAACAEAFLKAWPDDPHMLRLQRQLEHEAAKGDE